MDVLSLFIIFIFVTVSKTSEVITYKFKTPSNKLDQDQRKDLDLTISLAFLNEISNLSVLEDVITISLAHTNMCGLFDFKDVIGCLKLSSLDLSYNHLSEISNTIEHNQFFPNLNYINLSFNNISYFSIIIFTTMPQLKTIDLSFNNIKRIASFFKTRVIMPSVELIKVDGNKFHCNEIVNMLFYGASFAPKLQWLPKISYVETCSKDMYTAICNKTKLLCCRNDNAINYDFNKDFNETNMKKTTIPPSTSNNNNKNTYVVIISLLGLISCISSCIICREYHKVIIEKNKSLLLFVILF